MEDEAAEAKRAAEAETLATARRRCSHPVHLAADAPASLRW